MVISHAVNAPWTSYGKRVTKYNYVNWCKVLTEGTTMREGHEVKVLQVLFHYLAQAYFTKQWRHVWRTSPVCPSVTQYDKLTGFHDGYFADDSLFGFDTVHTGMLRERFRKNLPPPPSRLERLRTGGCLRWLEDMLVIVLFLLLIVLFLLLIVLFLLICCSVVNCAVLLLIVLFCC